MVPNSRARKQPSPPPRGVTGSPPGGEASAFRSAMPEAETDRCKLTGQQSGADVPTMLSASGRDRAARCVLSPPSTAEQSPALQPPLPRAGDRAEEPGDAYRSPHSDVLI